MNERNIPYRCLLLSLGLAAALAAGTIAAQSSRGSPDALLAVDQHRATVVDRIVADWGDSLHSSAGLSHAQLREMLDALRADQLLAASLAGSLAGVRDILMSGLTPSAPVAKALGDSSGDVVYTPVTPCRLVETRGTFAAVYQGGGAFTGGQVRNFAIAGGNGVCLTQLPAGLNASAVQLQVFGIPINGGASGDVEVLPQGAAFGSTATLVYLGSVPFTSASTTARINLANNQIGVQVRGGGAHLAIDVVGFFAAPQTTALQCTSVSSVSTVIAVSSDTLVNLPACAAGYTRTGSHCSGAGSVPGGYLLETNAAGCLFRNLSSVTPYNASATSTCCRIPGR